MIGRAFLCLISTMSLIKIMGRGNFREKIWVTPKKEEEEEEEAHKKLGNWER
jgi:hypothetical protein